MTSLADFVVVNENCDEAIAGDVRVFRSAEAACGWLEHWWVENGEGFAFTASGERLTLGVDDDNRVIVVSREVAPEGPSVVQSWLSSAAAAVLSQREHEGRLPTSVVELAAYVGFTD